MSAEDPSERIAALQAELDALKRREASFRAKMVGEFLDRGERNTYLHSLREECAALVKRGHEASADLEALTRKLEAAGQRADALETEITAIRTSLSWRLAAPLRSLDRLFGRRQSAGQPLVNGSPPAHGGVFTYFLHTSPFRIYRDATFTMRGWAWPEDGKAITGMRVNLDGRLFPGRHGLPEPEVVARYGPQPENPQPGFEVTFETPAGRHLLAIEAQVGGAEWRTIMCTSIWCGVDGK